MSTVAERVAGSTHNTLREGVVVGAIGATAVAAWFLVVDLIGAELFFTPTRLGAALGGLLGIGPLAEGGAVAFVVFTIVHYAVFAVIGVIATVIVHRSVAEPAILVGAFLAFVVSQALIYGFIALLHETELLEHLTWPLVAGANLIAAVLMAGWLWRTHPGLTARLGAALGERNTDEE